MASFYPRQNNFFRWEMVIGQFFILSHLDFNKEKQELALQVSSSVVFILDLILDNSEGGKALDWWIVPNMTVAEMVV